ncbi:MAG TPA: glycosyltransferase [Candidatus Methylacidiphilales bacterium]|jgi:poly(glycerol-phosphate) alpha-glucosyltransferase|nr:glycosyltransferase [Candidatus Methylacidiphilales bacterium]
MKTLCITDWVSRTNGGIFEAERRLQQLLHTKMGLGVEVVGLRDAKTDADLAAWAPLVPTACAVRGPAAFGYAPDLAPALARSGADLAYVAGLWKYPMLAAQRWARAARKPLIVAPHGMLEPWAVRHSGWKKKLAGRLFQDAQLRDAACLRALCAPEVASFRAYGLRNPVAVVPNGVDLSSLAQPAPPRPARFPAGRKVLLYLGRIHDKKGLAQLLAAWAQARDAASGWLLAIAGWDQGGHEAELKIRASQLGLAWSDAPANDANAGVLFLGPQFGPDKDACYAACDAFVLPSFSEGLPMVVLEAWARAKPVLMTPACNLPEGFAAGAALRIEPDAVPIASGLRALFEMSSENRHVMGRNGRALAEAKFDWRTVAAQMAAVYAWVLGSGPKPECVAEP